MVSQTCISQVLDIHGFFSGKGFLRRREEDIEDGLHEGEGTVDVRGPRAS